MSVPAAVTALKMHGAHNTFVLVDERGAPERDDYPILAQSVCRPDGGFGAADGLLVVRDAPDSVAAMRIFNADGSEAEMCGNGVRCVARYLYERGAGERFTIATMAGPIDAEIIALEPFAARVDVGEVSFPNGTAPQALDVDGTTWSYYALSLGNPHAVIFVDDVNAVDLEVLGCAFSRRIAGGTNVHVAQRLSDGSLKVRHFERGVGLTQACGTGAVASAAAAVADFGATSPLTVHVPGGTLGVDWGPGRTALLTGPAETLFERSLEG